MENAIINKILMLMIAMILILAPLTIHVLMEHVLVLLKYVPPLMFVMMFIVKMENVSKYPTLPLVMMKTLVLIMINALKEFVQEIVLYVMITIPVLMTYVTQLDSVFTIATTNPVMMVTLVLSVMYVAQVNVHPAVTKLNVMITMFAQANIVTLSLVNVFSLILMEIVMILTVVQKTIVVLEEDVLEHLYNAKEMILVMITSVMPVFVIKNPTPLFVMILMTVQASHLVSKVYVLEFPLNAQLLLIVPNTLAKVVCVSPLSSTLDLALIIMFVQSMMFVLLVFVQALSNNAIFNVLLLLIVLHPTYVTSLTVFPINVLILPKHVHQLEILVLEILAISLPVIARFPILLEFVLIIMLVQKLIFVEMVFA